MLSANDNQRQLIATLDHAVPGQAITIRATHCRFGQQYAEFVAHAGNGKHVMVRKLISSMWKARWTKPLPVERALVVKVHTSMVK